MRKKVINIAAALIVVLITAGCSEDNPPSDTLDDYIENPEHDPLLSELYFYPTTVRMIEKVLMKNGQEGLLEGVKGGRIIYGTDDSLDVLSRDIDQLKSGLSDEGFEFLGEFKSEGQHIVAYVREGRNNRYVAMLPGVNSTMVVELHGEVSLKTIRGLSQLNSESALSLFDFPSNEDEPEEEDDQKEGEEAIEAEETNEETNTTEI